jgi:hypothetical protein
MSTAPNKPSLPPSKAVEVINKLIDKTVQKKLQWNYSGDTVAARVSNDLVVHFEVSRLLTGELGWSRFVVISQDETVLEYKNSFTLNALLAAAIASSNPVMSAIHRLFNLVSTVGDAGLERAIKALDDL